MEYDGLITHGPLSADNPLLDEQDNPIPFQSVDHRSLLTTGSLFPLKVPADGYRVLHVGAPRNADVSILVQTLPQGGAATGGFTQADNKLANGLVTLDASAKTVKIGDWETTLEVRRDTTDTWSHRRRPLQRKEAGAIQLCRRLQAQGAGADSRVAAGSWDVRQFANLAQLQEVAGLPMVRFKLAVVWSQVQQLLQLRLAAPDRVVKHIDLISGGPFDRKPDGIERPINGGLILETKSGRLGIVARSLSLSVDRKGASLTLVRSPYICHHDPNPTPRPTSR